MNLLALPVLLPMLGAALALLAGRRPTVQRFVSVIALTGVVGVVGYLVYLAETEGVQTLWVAAWENTGIVLVADRLSTWMLLIASIVTLAVLVFSLGQDQDEVRHETPVSIFHPTFLLLCAGVSNAFLAGDLFNLYVGFEILLFASYVLLTMGATRPRIRAGATYVVVNLVSSSLFLILLAAVYAATGTVNLAQLSERIPLLPNDIQAVIQALMLTVFGIKAAVFPLSAWLPDSYPTAPAPVTAVFAGLLTKVGVYSMLRAQTLLFPHRPLTEVLLVLAGLSMIVGILGAIAQSELKRLLSFTLVSHMGYMIMGIGLATSDSLTATIYYTGHHITIQTALFLAAGLVARVGGSTALDRVSGLMAISPALAVMFGIPALNLSGIPPLSGFIGKVGLLVAGAKVGTGLAWTLVVASVVCSLLTLYAMAKVWNRMFWGSPQTTAEAIDPDDPSTGRPLPVVMVGATVGLIVLSLALTFLAGPIYEYCRHAAESLLAGGYRSVVLGER